MSGLFRRSTVLLLALAGMAVNAGALSDVSDWAIEGVNAAEANGLVSEHLQELEASEEISRAEFCSIVVNAYTSVSGKTVFVTPKRPFRDSDDNDVVAAYELGLVSGKGNGYFEPDAPITRQELCMMLYNILDAAKIEPPFLGAGATLEDFKDASKVSDYAKDAVELMVNCSILNGVSDTASGELTISPDGVATREQALIISDRFCNTFASSPSQEEILAKYGLSSSDAYSSPNYSGNYSYGGGISSNEKMQLVYGGGEKYQSEEEASSHMVDIAVRVWRLQPDGSKTTGTAYLEVNENLAEIYREIFDEIYNGSEQFPINDVGCYSWRTGEHSQGTAVDINPEENMEATINADGSLTPTCGTHWLPGIDPYSIPEGGDVYNAFISHGFTWGGNAWHSKRDYMHFSYFGR